MDHPTNKTPPIFSASNMGRNNHMRPDHVMTQPPKDRSRVQGWRNRFPGWAQSFPIPGFGRREI